jgi:hypothetical protein
MEKESKQHKQTYKVTNTAGITTAVLSNHVCPVIPPWCRSLRCSTKNSLLLKDPSVHFCIHKRPLKDLSSSRSNLLRAVTHCSCNEIHFNNILQHKRTYTSAKRSLRLRFLNLKIPSNTLHNMQHIFINASRNNWNLL